MNDPLARFVTSHGKRIEVVTLPSKTPASSDKRRDRFVMLPRRWLEILSEPPLAPGATWCMACHLIYLNWKHHNKPFKLPNGALKHDGISRHTKYRSLDNLEERGLITVTRRSRRSPIVRVHA